ncbi:MAG: hypothetical protein JXQ65_05855 [Candidatus Marinimicrobia bacterium]|nr:hypothetical protein [Candidatus Neomarinimicrobiota bacterium]
MIKNKKFHVISNTHWDREWRYSFQKNRQRLVMMIDSVLEILDTNPDYKAFHLDSQTIVLKDYLEIKPHNEARLKKHIREKRLFVGPWYILPEEFQVGGENLIRNLLIGHKIAREFGHVMKVGYSPFSWGQISQLPQIYKGFHIPLIMFYRGVNSLDSKQAEFIWEGADGTRTLTSRFSTMPRYNFYFYIYRPVVHNEFPTDVEYPYERGGTAFHFTDKELIHEDYSLIHPVQEYHSENLKPAVEKIIRDQVRDFTTSHVFWAEGHDTSGPNTITPKIIADINHFIKEGKVIHSNLEEYAKGLLNEIDPEKLPVVTGERRSAQYDNRSGNLYGYTTSARMYLKQANFKAEKWVQYYAEPLNTLAGILGMDTRDRSIDMAWDLIVQNSAHDSIGGCSLDEIHEDNMNRTKQSIEISQCVVDRACQYIVSKMELKNDINLLIYNPLNYLRNEVLETWIDVPEKMDLGSIELLCGGQKLDIKILDRQKNEPVLEQLIDRPMYFSMIRYHLLMSVGNIPQIGFKTIEIKPVKSVKPSPFIQSGNLSDLENEHLKVTINKNGTLNILHKESGHEYQNQAYFYDEGEAGHAWVHTSVSPIITTLDKVAKVAVLEENSFRKIVRIKNTLELPIDLEARQSGGKTLTTEIFLDVILRKNSKHVELNIQFDNQVEAHRIRILFPTGIEAEYSWGEGQFDVVKRPIARPDTSDWIEQPMYDYPMHHFVDVSDGNHGVAILVDGLKEYEVLEDSDSTIALTLLRSFYYKIPVASLQDYSHQKGTQCLGQQVYKLGFYPHSGNSEQAGVQEEAMVFNYEPRIIQTGKNKGERVISESFIEIENQKIAFSSLKISEDRTGFILRVFNPTSGKITTKIKTFFAVSEIFETTLEEVKENKVTSLNQHNFLINLLPKEIKTIQLIIE